MNRSNLIENRQIRVFISSTFQDMEDERDYLMKRTFPKLRKLAAERDVTLTELDLRWGITEEESKSGKVVEICLREIENSIPFFIGIIGNRYGWVPEKRDLDGNVTERYHVVDNYLDLHLSVTEMEMQFGVLQREEDMHAYFYIKDKMEKQDNPEMLNRLKAEVEACRYPSSTYSSPENLAEQVEQAFVELLDKLFPEGTISELEKERIGQRSYMHQLCQNYIRDDKNFHILDEWMQNWKQHQLVITGASGLGKSALIANWIYEKVQDKDRRYNIIYHFTGNGGSESSSEYIIQKLINEIFDLYGWKDEEFSDQALKKDILNKLFEKINGSANRPLLIVLDAINQIFDTDNAKRLDWLPIPSKNIKILFSTLEDDPTMRFFKGNLYNVFDLHPIDVENRKVLINSYLRLYGKKLSQPQIDRIALDKQCENTLVLRTLLDELINFGVYEKLDDRIEFYLSQETIDDFYQALLQNYEEVFGEGLVKNCLTVISISRMGVTERELIKISHARQIDWSQLYCALYSFLTTGNGLISFAHRHISEAISKRYMLSYNEKIPVFRKELKELVSQVDQERAFYEIPYQLFHLEENVSLFKYLKNNLDQLITSEEHYTFLYVEKLLANKICSLMDFVDVEPIDVGRIYFFFRHNNIVGNFQQEINTMLVFAKPYLSKIFVYPSLIHVLAKTYSSIDIHKAIELYKLGIDYYGKGILLPPPGYLRQEEQLEIWHEIQRLNQLMKNG